jgi:hypothetical protein
MNNKMALVMKNELFNSYNEYKNKGCITINELINITWKLYNNKSINDCTMMCNSTDLCKTFQYESINKKCIIWYNSCAYEEKGKCTIWYNPCISDFMIKIDGVDSYTNYNSLSELTMYITFICIGIILLFFFVCCISCIAFNNKNKNKNKNKINTITYIESDCDDVYNVIIENINTCEDVPIANTLNNINIPKPIIPFASSL